MPEYLSPGVYVEEVERGARPIEGVGTATAAFVGMAPAGPVKRPVLITSWSQYVETFGSLDESGRRNPHLAGSYLSHAVYGYFLNGGGRCFVARIGERQAGGGARPQLGSVQLPSRTSNALPSLTVTPQAEVQEEIQLEVVPPANPDGNDSLFTLRVRRGDVEELYENVSLGRRGVKNVVETVNQTSRLVTVAEAQSTGSIAERAPAAGTYVLKAPETAMVPVQSEDFVGDVAERSGLQGLEVAEEVTMVCCPDVVAAYQAGMLDRDGVKAVQLGMIAHCERMGDRVAILDPLPDLSPQEVQRWRERETNFDSRFAALYYPWIKVDSPNGHGPDRTRGPRAVPPCGHIAGVYARNDTERGVHKAPANEVLRGALEPVVQVTKGEQDILNPTGVNCIRSFTGRGLRVWGARTLSSDPAWRYINVRRLFNYVEKSIERGTQWVVFEPNDADLWARVRRDVGAFLTGVWRDGMLFGNSPAQAFYVKCDEELNPPDVRDRGQLVIEVGLAPVKPAEFVIFRVSQFAGGGA